MLESIRKLTDIPPQGGDRFSREDLTAARHRRHLLDTARRRASQHIAQANDESDSIRAYAFQEGYGHGILQASADMAELLVRSRVLGAQLRQDLAQAAEQLLGDLLQQDQWLEQALAQWLGEQQATTAETLYVLMPGHCRSKGKDLAEGLRSRWDGPVSIEYHDQERYLLRMGHQVLEFDLKSIRERLAPRLMARVKALPDAIRSLDEGFVQVLRKHTESYLTEPPEPCSQTLSGDTDNVA